MYSGVAVVVRQRAAFRGAVGVVPNSDVGDGEIVGFVGDIHVLAGFTGNSTQMGTVAVESTRPAV